MIQTALQKLEHQNEFDIMTFVPINYLTESLFYKYILNINSEFYKNILASLQQVEKSNLIVSILYLINIM